jgi:transposase
VKTNKSDYIDAEAIAEAVGRPKMRFVPIRAMTNWFYSPCIGYGSGG